MPYKAFQQDGGKWKVYKIDADNQPVGDALGEHDSEDEAKKQVKALYANEPGLHSSEFVLFDDAQYSEFVTTKPGTPYRLFPFGTLYKGGAKREITKEYASKFRLPHFKPPIKLGSHDERTPAGGHIIGLQVREDGLYAVPEFNEQGNNSLANGDYRYHSPEVIWDENSGLEDPQTGGVIPGPFIVGDALLHTPHLGEAAALYSFEINPTKGETHNMADEMVSVPKNIFDRFAAWLDRLTAEAEKPAPVTPEPAKTEPETPAAQVVEVEKFEALKAERDNLEAERKAAVEKLAAIEAEKARAEMLQDIVAQLQDQGKFGMQFVQLKDAEEAAGMMGGMQPEQREWCMRMFSALASKVNTSALYGELGSNGAGVDDPEAALDAAIKAKANEAKTDYNTAMNLVRAEKPDLFNAKKEGK